MFKQLTSYFSPTVKKQVQPESYAETGGTAQNRYFSQIMRTQRQLNQYISIYERGGLISEAIDLYSLFMFSKGFTWEGDPRAIDTCRDFMDGFDFELSFNLAVTSPLVCADGFQEILRSKGGDILGLLYRNPVPFNILLDEYGIVSGYEQQITNRLFFNKKIPFEENQIFHTQIIPSLREGYGTSLIQRCIDEIQRETRISQGVANAIERHGTTKWWARAGTSGNPVTQKVLDDLAKSLAELNSKNDIATQYDVEIKELDQAGVGNISSYQDYSLIRLCGSMGVPGELLGYRQGTTDNTAVSRIGAFLQKCDTFNHRFSRALNIQVFDQVTQEPGAARIKFNSVLPSKRAEDAAWIVNLIKANPLNPEAYAPVEWVRQTLGIPNSIEETA